MTYTTTSIGWILDSSTFINSINTGKPWILPIVRFPLFFPEYVLRVELGSGARKETRLQAEALISKEHVFTEKLTLEDLERIAELAAPKRIGMGEICCAILAERQGRGILCDDRKACNWLRDRVAITTWESIDEILVSGGVAHHLSEYEVEDCQKLLEQNKYECKYNLRFAVLSSRLSPSN